MKFYTKTLYYCGIDLHARNLYVCILDSEGNICTHKNIKASPELLLKLTQPYLPDMVLGVECMFPATAPALLYLCILGIVLVLGGLFLRDTRYRIRFRARPVHESDSWW